MATTAAQVRIDILRPIPGDRDQAWAVDCRTCGVTVSRHRSQSAALLGRTGHLDRRHPGAELAPDPDFARLT
jgi:hypothetical protein